MKAIASTLLTSFLLAMPTTANAQGWPGPAVPPPRPYAGYYGSYSGYYGSQYAAPYGNAYARPYGNVYTAPYGNAYAAQYGSAYSSPYGTPYAAPYGGVPAAANLNGIWYMNGEQDKPTRIVQYGPTRALFINEHGTQAWGSVQGNRVWIPDWTWGEGWATHQGLWGTYTGDRLVWPDGSFWSR